MSILTVMAASWLKLGLLLFFALVLVKVVRDCVQAFLEGWRGE